MISDYKDRKNNETEKKNDNELYYKTYLSVGYWEHCNPCNLFLNQIQDPSFVFRGANKRARTV